MNKIVALLTDFSPAPRWLIVTLLSLLLSAVLPMTGCTHSANRHLNQIIAMTMPENTLTDYQTTPCSQIWELREKETKVMAKNTLYWLRIMSCAEQLSTAQARTLAETLPRLSWSDTLKRDILINKAGPSVSERYAIVEHVDNRSHELPDTLLPIIQLWREQQALQLLLMQEKARYQRLQSAADSQIDRLREHEVRLQHKLANLTDIEHQLSSRKQLQHESTMTEIADNATATSSPTAENNPPEIKPGWPPATTETILIETRQQEAPLMPYAPIENESAHSHDVNNTPEEMRSSPSS